ncbi:MAG: hypothetical protein AAF702_11600 [Chloroflexota bacterium]
MNYERETLVAYLRQYGITYLAPSDAVATEVIESEQELVRSLLLSGDERLQMALVPLFIRNVHLSKHIPVLIEKLSPENALDLKTYYMAAVYLQQIWHIRLGFYIDNSVSLPDLFSGEMNLPSPGERFGKVGLYDLVDDWRNRSIFPFNYMASLNKVMDLFFEDLILTIPEPHYAPAN